MPARTDISSSGLIASRQRVAVSAHNTANLSTDGFERQRIIAAEKPTGGVETRLDTVSLSPEARRLAESIPGPQNNADAASETVDRLDARAQFTANARALRVQNNLTRSAIDVLA